MKGTLRRRCWKTYLGGLVLVFVCYLVEPIKGVEQHQAMKAFCSANAEIICIGSAPLPLTNTGPSVEKCARLVVALTFSGRELSVTVIASFSGLYH